ncbi:MAG: hypothetical protein ACOZAA_06390 [Pseudomonadota bacterium]
MKLATTSAYDPNHETETFGDLDETHALAKFDEFPWSDLARQTRDIELKEEDCVDADLTFLIDKCHFTARVKDNAMSFDVEVCVRLAKKLLGIFDRPKFYAFDGLPTKETREALRVFLAKSDEDQHAYFQNLTDQCRK